MLHLPSQSPLYNFTYYEIISCVGIKMQATCTLASRSPKLGARISVMKRACVDLSARSSMHMTR